MQSSPHRVPQPSAGEHCDQQDHDHGAHGQHDGGPAGAQGTARIVPDEQLDPHTQKRRFRKEVRRHGDIGKGEGAKQQGEHLHQDGGKGHDGQGKAEKPFVRRGVEGDQEQIKAHRHPVKKKGDIDGKPGVDHRGQGQDEQDQTGSHDEQGPQAPRKYQEVQRQAA